MKLYGTGSRDLHVNTLQHCNGNPYEKILGENIPIVPCDPNEWVVNLWYPTTISTRLWYVPSFVAFSNVSNSS